MDLNGLYGPLHTLRTCWARIAGQWPVRMYMAKASYTLTCLKYALAEEQARAAARRHGVDVQLRGLDGHT